MARDSRRWDDDMAASRRAHEIHELATQGRHRRNLAHRQAIHARQADGEGSNAIDAGWGDDRRLQAKNGGAITTSRGRVV
jgi:hypothetical protein